MTGVPTYSRRMYSQNRLNVNRIPRSFPRFAYSTCRPPTRSQSLLMCCCACLWRGVSVIPLANRVNPRVRVRVNPEGPCPCSLPIPTPLRYFRPEPPSVCSSQSPLRYFRPVQSPGGMFKPIPPCGISSVKRVNPRPSRRQWNRPCAQFV